MDQTTELRIFYMGYSETPTKGPAMPEIVYPVLIALFLCAVYWAVNRKRSTK